MPMHRGREIKHGNTPGKVLMVLSNAVRLATIVPLGTRSGGKCFHFGVDDDHRREHKMLIGRCQY
jgi:hypothetical protein